MANSPSSGQRATSLLCPILQNMQGFIRFERQVFLVLEMKHMDQSQISLVSSNRGGYNIGREPASRIATHDLQELL